jgi:5-methylcytosine-specific restriction protein B
MNYQHILSHTEVQYGRLTISKIRLDPTALAWFEKHSGKYISLYKSDGSLARRNVLISASKGNSWRIACGSVDIIQKLHPGDKILIRERDDANIEIVVIDDDFIENKKVIEEISPLNISVKQQVLFNDNINTCSDFTYTIDQYAEEICFEETAVKLWIRAINRKKQAIFYGSPGTGKTFIAEKLAKHLISEGDGFSELVQFHPAYSYEDFIQGIRPQSKDGKLTYPVVPGRFLEFCQKAESFQDICVLIIDEINRANLAQVFGELMYLLEYRNQEIPLAGGNRFRIPENVRIIGTMNTADRSIAQIDHALRRRFAFIELRPNYDVLIQYHLNTNFAVMDLINVLKQLNQAINDKNYEIGISFFLTPNLREDIEDIWKMEIEPYLEEYFFNNLEKVDEFRWDKIEKQITI